MNTETLKPAAVNTPWYRQAWPWFLISLPATAVVAGTATLLIAVNTWDGLVVDDYYKEGKAIVQTIDRLNLAKKLGLNAALGIDDGRVSLQVSAVDSRSVPETVILTIIHPTQGGRDQTLVLNRLGSEAFVGSIEPLTPGRWLFQIENESRSWRLNGAANLPAEQTIEILPQNL